MFKKKLAPQKWAAYLISFIISRFFIKKKCPQKHINPNPSISPPFFLGKSRIFPGSRSWFDHFSPWVFRENSTRHDSWHSTNKRRATPRLKPQEVHKVGFPDFLSENRYLPGNSAGDLFGMVETWPLQGLLVTSNWGIKRSHWITWLEDHLRTCK